MIAIVEIHCRNYTHYTIYVIATVISLSFLFLDGFQGNANISIAIKSGSTVASKKDVLSLFLDYVIYW